MPDGRASELQIPDDAAFEFHSARVARALWIALLLLMAAGVLGVFGRGPLSDAVAVTGDGSVQVHYDRFVRAYASTALDIEVRPSEGGVVAFVLSREYLDAFHIDGIHPLPVEMVDTSDGMRFRFAAADQGPTRIRVQLRPVRIWRIDGELQTAAHSAGWWQITYP